MQTSAVAEGGTMNDIYLIKIFCILDDTIKQQLSMKDDCRSKFSNSEVIFVGIIAARFFSGNIRMAFSFLFCHKYLTYHISESRLNRRIRSIDCWNQILQVFANNDSHYIVDSFPVSSCRISREQRSRLFKGKQFKGYNASHKTFFHGLKVHLIISKVGSPFAFQITPGSEHDLTALKYMALPFSHKIFLYADKAYNDAKFEKQLKKDKIYLIPQRRENSLKNYGRVILSRLKKYRKRVETAISGIVQFMPRWIQAVSNDGFETKIALFIVAYATTFLN